MLPIVLFLGSPGGVVGKVAGAPMPQFGVPDGVDQGRAPMPQSGVPDGVDQGGLLCCCLCHSPISWCYPNCTGVKVVQTGAVTAVRRVSGASLIFGAGPPWVGVVSPVQVVSGCLLFAPGVRRHGFAMGLARGVGFLVR